MSSKRPIYYLGLLLVLTGCSIIQVSQDYDPQADLSRYRTWQWREPFQAPVGDERIDNPLIDQRIRKAVEIHLAARQMHRRDGSPDLTLRYYLSIEPKIESTTYYPSLGIRRYWYPWYEDLEVETHVRQYDESRLTIDFLAADTGQLLWRGTGVYRFITHGTPQEAATEIQKVVDKILMQFPPNQ